jgi:hypothetical protein
MIGCITNYNPQAQLAEGIVTVDGEEREFEKPAVSRFYNIGDTIQVSPEDVKEVNLFDEPEFGEDTYQRRNW